MIQIIYSEPSISEYVADFMAIEFWLQATRKPSIRTVDHALSDMAAIVQERQQKEAELRELNHTIEALSYVQI